MNESALPTIVIAGLCVVATGFAAATLPSSLSTQPREAVTEGAVPIVADIVTHVRPLAERLADELRGDVSPPEEATPPPTLSGTPPDDIDARGSAPPPADVATGSRAGSDETSPAPDAESDRLNPTLLLPLVGLIAGVGWYLRRRGGEQSTADGRWADRRTGGGPSPFPERTADASAEENGVYRAWAALLDAADVRYPTARTPAECAARAVDRGFDPDAVGRLRTEFEAVRYGDEPATDRRVQRAERALRDAGVRR